MTQEKLADLSDKLGVDLSRYKTADWMYNWIQSDVVFIMTTDYRKRTTLSKVLSIILTLYDFSVAQKLHIEYLIDRCHDTINLPAQNDVLSAKNDGDDKRVALQNELAYSLAAVSNRLSYKSLLEKSPEEITPFMIGIDKNWYRSLAHIDDILIRFQLAALKEVNLHTEFGKQWAEHAQSLTEQYLTLFKRQEI